jgi:hypothetical protein
MTDFRAVVAPILASESPEIIRRFLITRHRVLENAQLAAFRAHFL